jgi:hypothetical protein
MKACFEAGYGSYDLILLIKKNAVILFQQEATIFHIL